MIISRDWSVLMALPFAIAPLLSQLPLACSVHPARRARETNHTVSHARPSFPLLTYTTDFRRKPGVCTGRG
jgi:hypothetical protein